MSDGNNPLNFYEDHEDYFMNYGQDYDNAFSDSPKTKAYYTNKLDTELSKPTNEINYDTIHSLIRAGADLDHRDSKGHSFFERAGMRMRYDIVDLIARARYTDV